MIPFIPATLKRLEKAMSVWPAGSTVWHRASGRRGIVDGWKVCGDGMICISVTDGTSSSVCYPFELSRVRVGENDDGEQWRNPDGTEEAQS